MKSMTGYGRGEALRHDRKFVAEIKSVNHRYNEVTVKMPRAMIMYEDAVKKLIGKKVFRGKTDVFISFESFSDSDVSIEFNRPLADAYVKALGEINERYKLDSQIRLDLIAKFPDVITVDKTVADDNGEIWECLEAALTEAVDNFVAMRTTEGEALKKDILEKLAGIKATVEKIEKRAPMVAEDYRQRLIAKLNEYAELNVDEARIITEVTIFADKACIDEEITRLFSHIEQMKSIVCETAAVGRKLDFLVQEMNREVNTIGSKSNDLEITNYAVELKSEIEKIREQIQNIE
ncbi:MAG: YicC family protein [Firmicutes bacterium]|nr:YicC family protein [Bacillota bacterium]MBQ9604242.1 YicC family protein [Bacillota bacterium]